MRRAENTGAIGKTRPRLIIDTNLLLLAIVGTVNRSLIGTFDRTRKYGVADYDAVISEMPRYSKLAITPGIAVETSNWIGYLKGLDYEVAWNHFCNLVKGALEVPVASSMACDHADSLSLRITDCSILIAAEKDTVVLTDDHPLYTALLDNGIKVLHLKQLL